MARARSLNSRIPQSLRRKVDWGLGPSTGGVPGGVQAISATGPVIGTNGIFPTVSSPTIVRIRGYLSLYISVSSTALDGFHGAFGIGKVTTAAFTAGVASIPTPLTENDWDGWMYHQFFDCTAVMPVAVASTSKSVPSGPGAIYNEIDTKSMRKADQEDTFFCAIEVQEIGTATMQWHCQTRMLFKLA